MKNAQPIVVLEDVSKVYASGEIELRALDHVDLGVMRGELVAIMGASGSGKSTLMNVLGCLDRPTSGRYLLGGREVSGLDRNALADIRSGTIGFVFQSFNLLKRTTALENVELPLLYAGVEPQERTARARRALERVGLADRVDHVPSRLSGGQQQRVAIARAIVNEPLILLADEPTGNLDSKTADSIMALFQELWRSGLTILYVTHEDDVAACAERVVTMRDGRIIADVRQVPRPAELPATAA